MSFRVQSRAQEQLQAAISLLDEQIRSELLENSESVRQRFQNAHEEAAQTRLHCEEAHSALARQVALERDNIRTVAQDLLAEGRKLRQEF